MLSFAATISFHSSYATKSYVLVTLDASREKPDNTEQFRWIVTIQGGLDVLFKDDINVFVARDLLWYPVEGDNKIRQAPDDHGCI